MQKTPTPPPNDAVRGMMTRASDGWLRNAEADQDAREAVRQAIKERNSHGPWCNEKNCTEAEHRAALKTEYAVRGSVPTIYLMCKWCGRGAKEGIDVSVDGGDPICLPCFTKAVHWQEDPTLTALRQRVAAEYMSRGDMEAERDRLNAAFIAADAREQTLEAEVDALQKDLEAWDALIVEAGGASCFDDEGD